MLTQKNQQDDRNSRFRIKVAFIALVFALMVIIQPIFAARNRSNRSSNRAAQSRQQTQRAAPAPRAPANAGRTQSQSFNSRSSAQTRSNIQRPTIRSNNRPTLRSNVQGLNRAPSSNRSNRQTITNRRNTIISRQNPVSSPNNKINIQRQPSNAVKAPDPRQNNSNLQRNAPSNSNQVINPNRDLQTRDPISQNNSITSRNQSISQNNTRTQRQSIFSNLFGNRKKENSNTTQRPTATQSRTLNLNRNRTEADTSNQSLTDNNSARQTRTERNTSIRSLFDRINTRRETGNNRTEQRNSRQNTSSESSAAGNNRTQTESRSIARSIGRRNSSQADDSRQPSINRDTSSRENTNERNSRTSIRSLFDRVNSRNEAGRNRTDSQNSRETRNSDSILGGNITNNNRTQGRTNEITDNTGRRERRNPTRDSSDRTGTNSRQRTSRSADNVSIQGRTGNTSLRIDRDTVRQSARHTRILYHDRPNLVRGSRHSVYTYRDRLSRLRYRIIRPRQRYIIGYHSGPHFVFRPFWPYYHRKYIFVSLWGWWPWDYTYTRYYWYGCHPYYWYGYYPIAREVGSNTYNYYTYNYYGVDDTAPQSYESTDYLEPVDENTFADVREKLNEQPAEPTVADLYFENAVKAFGSGDYDTAVEKFAQAIKFAPEDKILPFAYSQALLANAQYADAAVVLRGALANVDSEKEGVFYPRGLYPDDETLLSQIDSLIETAELNTNNSDLQLLLGYQLLGMGETEQAAAPLLIAAEDPVNAEAAAKLLELREKIKESQSEQGEIQDSDTNTEPTTPAAEVISEAGSISVTPQLGRVTDEMYAVNTKETALLAVLFTLATGSGAYHYFKS